SFLRRVRARLSSRSRNSLGSASRSRNNRGSTRRSLASRCLQTWVKIVSRQSAEYSLTKEAWVFANGQARSAVGASSSAVVGAAVLQPGQAQESLLAQAPVGMADLFEQRRGDGLGIAVAELLDAEATGRYVGRLQERQPLGQSAVADGQRLEQDKGRGGDAE